MIDNVNVKYSYSSSTYTTLNLLNSLPSIVACDFECANRLSINEIKKLKEEYEITKNIKLIPFIEADGLSHPSLSTITHFSIAWNEAEAFVAICDSYEMKKLVMKWLVTTDRLQLWHNSVFDFAHIHYHTGLFPKNFEDTKLLAKTLLNNADNVKGNVELKSLMGYKYGAWSLSKETSFSIENMHNIKMIEYSATDACATIALYYDILRDLPESERCKFEYDTTQLTTN